MCVSTATEPTTGHGVVRPGARNDRTFSVSLESLEYEEVPVRVRSGRRKIEVGVPEKRGEVA